MSYLVNILLLPLMANDVLFQVTIVLKNPSTPHGETYFFLHFEFLLLLTIDIVHKSWLMCYDLDKLICFSSF